MICWRRIVKTKLSPTDTEDYLLTVINDGIESKLTRSIKYLDDLVFYADDSTKIKQEKKRRWELLTVQRVYFESRGIPWKLITDQSISENTVANLERMLMYVDKQKDSTDESITNETLRCFERTCNMNDKEELNIILKQTSDMSGASYEDTVSYFWQLCWHKDIKFDLKSQRLELDSIITPHEFFSF